MDSTRVGSKMSIFSPLHSPTRSTGTASSPQSPSPQPIPTLISSPTASVMPSIPSPIAPSSTTQPKSWAAMVRSSGGTGSSAGVGLVVGGGSSGGGVLGPAAMAAETTKKNVAGLQRRSSSAR